jgi:hypothetical protein
MVEMYVDALVNLDEEHGIHAPAVSLHMNILPVKLICSEWAMCFEILVSVLKFKATLIVILSSSCIDGKERS